MRFASSHILGQFFLLGDIHPRAHESLERFALNHGNACASNGANLPIRAHDSLRKVEFAVVGQHLVDCSRDKIPIFRMYKRHVFLGIWWITARIEAVDRKQLGRPILETGRVEGPTASVRKPLSLRKVELRLFPFFDIKVNPDPIKQGSIARQEWFGATQKPTIRSFSATNSEGYLAFATIAKTG